MFTRDEQYRDVVMCPVRIKLVNDEIILGVIEKPRIRTLYEFLSNEDRFLCVELYDSDKIQIAKHAILSCRQNDQPKVDQLKVGLMKTDIYDPFSVLGLEPDAKRDAVREAYISLARQYHPDRYQGMELPKEIAEYVLTMTKRLNIAFNDANERLDDIARKKSRAGAETTRNAA